MRENDQSYTEDDLWELADSGINALAKMQYYKLPHQNVVPTRIFKSGGIYKMNYVQAVINYVAEGFCPHEEMWKQDTYDLGKVLLLASALTGDPYDQSALIKLAEEKYSKNWLTFLQDCLNPDVKQRQDALELYSRCAPIEALKNDYIAPLYPTLQSPHPQIGNSQNLQIQQSQEFTQVYDSQYQAPSLQQQPQVPYTTGMYQQPQLYQSQTPQYMNNMVQMPNQQYGQVLVNSTGSQNQYMIPVPQQQRTISNQVELIKQEHKFVNETKQQQVLQQQQQVMQQQQQFTNGYQGEVIQQQQQPEQHTQHEQQDLSKTEKLMLANSNQSNQLIGSFKYQQVLDNNQVQFLAHSKQPAMKS